MDELGSSSQDLPDGNKLKYLMKASESFLRH